MNDEKDDDNPWDDDGGGRTLATDGPSFELPSNIPSPITAPPPAPAGPPPRPAKNPATSTLVGLMPDDFHTSLPKGAAPVSRPVPRPAAGRPLPPPVVLGADDLAELPGPHEDGRTLAIASPVSTRPLRDDALLPEHQAPSFGYVPDDGPVNDKEAETQAALSRDELFGFRAPQVQAPGRDAQVVVGDDAIGDDATLAIGPGQLHQLVPQHQQQQLAQQLLQPEHYPAPPPHAPPPPPQSWQGEAAQSYRNPPPPPQGGFDPMMPQQQQQQQPYEQYTPQGQFPPSGQHPSLNGPQSSPGWGPNPQMMQQGQAPAGWAPQAGAPPEAAPSTGIQFTPQVLLLIGVGVVCLAIFVIGVVLFATTKF